MSDLLIRDLPADLKQDIALRAKRSGRSLSEEAKRILAGAMMGDDSRKPLGQGLREVFKEAGYVDLDLPPRTDMPANPLSE